MVERLAGVQKINNIIKGPYDQKINIWQHPTVESMAGVKKINNIIKGPYDKKTSICQHPSWTKCILWTL